MNTLIFGHSFIHRLKSYLHNPPQGHNPSLFDAHTNITCIGKGGSYLSGAKYNCLMHNVHLHVSTTNTHTVIISLGTNDLDSGVSPIQVAHSIYALAQSILATYNIRYVFVDQIINRDTVLFPGFQLRAKEANDALQQLIEKGNNPSIRFWHHLNFQNPKQNLLCEDGVHLNKVGIKKYWRSLRGAILFAGHH